MKLPRGLSGSNAINAFERAGWEQVRIRGSHVMLQKLGQDYTLCVPLHDELDPGLLRRLVRDSGLKVEEFIRLL